MQSIVVADLSKRVSAELANLRQQNWRHSENVVDRMSYTPPERVKATGCELSGIFGAGGGTRTHTTLPSRDFKSLASTSSATSALSSIYQILSAFSGEVELR